MLPANYASLQSVLNYSDLPAAGSVTGQKILIASIGGIATWSGSAWSVKFSQQAAAQADFVATMVSEIVTQQNAFLAKLRAAGIIAT